jgi:hypothetical protein
MSDTLDWFMRDVDAGFQPSYGDSVAALDALREARAEIDALRARAERAERERDEARRLVTSRWPAGGMVPTVALEAEVSKRSDLEREFARYRNATIEDGERLRAEVERLRSALTAARGEEREHG